MNLIKSTLGEAGIENQASWSPLNPVRLKFASTNSNWIPANVVNGCNSSEKRRIICKRSQFREIRTNTRWQEKKMEKTWVQTQTAKKNEREMRISTEGGRQGGGEEEGGGWSCRTPLNRSHRPRRFATAGSTHLSSVLATSVSQYIHLNSVENYRLTWN